VKQTPLAPRQLGYRMPAEWEHHEATWLAWPKNTGTWARDISKVQDAFLEMVRLIVPGERVELLVDEEAEADRIRPLLTARGIEPERVRFHPVRTVDAWIRDYGPNFLTRQDMDGPVYNRWRFNGWGKYEDMLPDARVCGELAPVLGGNCFEPPMVLEGGAIDVNGTGLCLTTESCLLSPNRNPQMAREEAEGLLKDYLGLEEVLWLAGGLAGDDTDGHVDNAARFVSARTVVAAFTGDESDESAAVLEENYARLRNYGGRGGPLEVVKLPVPSPADYGSGQLPASYANFYIANRAVLVPVFGDGRDEEALGLLKGFFPGREVAGVDCRVMIRGLGAIHCVTQQQPG